MKDDFLQRIQQFWGLATLLERVGLKKISSRVIQFLKYKKWCSKCSVVGGDSVFRECYQSTVKLSEK